MSLKAQFYPLFHSTFTISTVV